MKRLCPLWSLLLSVALPMGCGGGSGPGQDDAGEGGGAVPSEPSATLAAYCDGVKGWDASWDSFESQVLVLVNQKRAAGATCGGVARPKVAALTLDARLRCAARVQSKDMGTHDFMDHTGSDGSTPWQRMNNAGYAWTQAAENVAAGQATPAAVVDSWMNSPGHCNNLMAEGLTHLGVGYFYAPSSTYKHYWTQDFGRQ